MTWHQHQLSLPAQRRGVHLVTQHIVEQLPSIQHCSCGLCHLFLQHTSASLAINENADPDVRIDMKAWLDRTMPENEPYYRHTCEGPDDMPAHIKTMVLGHSLTIPISNGALALGTWQGIYLCEHRDYGGSRRILATIHGE